MEAPNSSQTEVPKLTSNQMMFCPWIPNAPLHSTSSINGVLEASNQQGNCPNMPKSCINCHHSIASKTCNVNQQFACSPIQQSSEQFFNFLRLMQLFPDVHPATLHTVLVLCKNQLFCAVDKLIYAKKCKEMYSNRTSCQQQKCTTTSSAIKVNRYKPYPCSRASDCPNETCRNFNSSTDLCGLKQQAIDHHLVKYVGKDGENVHARNSKGSECSSMNNDLPPVVSPKCRLPIRPLSPINTQSSQDQVSVTKEQRLY